jgi:hypothetical protein
MDDAMEEDDDEFGDFAAADDLLYSTAGSGHDIASQLFKCEIQNLEFIGTGPFVWQLIVIQQLRNTSLCSEALVLSTLIQSTLYFFKVCF